METFVFKTDDVEEKLYDISGAFQALKFAVYGLSFQKLINDDELNGFCFIISEASKKAESLISNLKPVRVDENGHIISPSWNNDI